MPVCSTGGLRLPSSSRLGASLSVLCPCIHLLSLCHQVSPASISELRNWEAQTHPLRNRPLSLTTWNCLHTTQHSSNWIYIVNLEYRGQRPSSFLKQSCSVFLNCYSDSSVTAISVSHCSLNKRLFSACKKFHQNKLGAMQTLKNFVYRLYFRCGYIFFSH